MAWYLEHEDLETPENGLAIFGPFSESELEKVENDAYAEYLSSFGELCVVWIGKIRAGQVYTNTKKYWIKQLRHHDQ